MLLTGIHCADRLEVGKTKSNSEKDIDLGRSANRYCARQQGMLHAGKFLNLMSYLRNTMCRHQTGGCLTGFGQRSLLPPKSHKTRRISRLLRQFDITYEVENTFLKRPKRKEVRRNNARRRAETGEGTRRPWMPARSRHQASVIRSQVRQDPARLGAFVHWHSLLPQTANGCWGTDLLNGSAQTEANAHHPAETNGDQAAENV